MTTALPNSHPAGACRHRDRSDTGAGGKGVGALWSTRHRLTMIALRACATCRLAMGSRRRQPMQAADAGKPVQSQLALARRYLRVGRAPPSMLSPGHRCAGHQGHNDRLSSESVTLCPRSHGAVQLDLLHWRMPSLQLSSPPIAMARQDRLASPPGTTTPSHRLGRSQSGAEQLQGAPMACVQSHHDRAVLLDLDVRL